MRAPTSMIAIAPMLLVAAAACNEDPVTPAASCTDDTGAVAVTVSGSATAPVFDWSPPCAVALLLVESGSSDRWLIGTDDATWADPAQANLFEPPVTYGVAPTTAEDEYGPELLVPGQPYEVILWRVPPGSTADCTSVAFGACMLALHEWTP